MPGGGTRTFFGPDAYEAGLRQAEIECIITGPPGFNARLTWVELHHSQLFRCEEDFPRIGYVSFPRQLACISFPANPGPMPRWRGTEMQAGDIMLHSLGERLHQTAQGPSIWSLITLDPMQLDDYSRVLVEKPVTLPAEARVLRPTSRDAARWRRLHAQACRLAETKPKILSHPEVARAIEQDLLHALVTCLAGAKIYEEGAAKRNHALVMVRLEEVLGEHFSRPLHIPELCELIGVGERTLRSCCADFLGISLSRYILLRRLKQVRRALGQADPDTTGVSAIARRYGFTQLGRFAGAYRSAFNESPSTTLRRGLKARLAAE
jgi:AraC-like DNA-binding protein